MKIPRNFDRWMFDYKEGNLSQSEMDYFENFMSENPQFNADINAWNESYIPKQNLEYPGMVNLQKERKFAGWYGLAASITILIAVSIGGFYLTSNTNQLYTLRDYKFNGFTSPAITESFDLNANSQSSVPSNQNQFNGSAAMYHGLNTVLSSTDENQITPEYSTLESQQNVISLEQTSTTSQKSEKTNNKSVILKDELNKIESNQSKSHSAHYKNNPNYKSEQFNFNVRSKSKYGTFGYKLKKVIRKIEKMSGYPVGLTNLKDPDLLIPNSNLLDFNGGFVGGFGTPRVEARYRNQWMSHENNLQTSFLSFDTYSKSLRGGIGVILNSNDFNTGAFTDNRISFFYSPKFELNSKIYFEPSIKMTMGLMTLNTSKLNTDTPYEVERGRIIKTSASTDIQIANNLWYKDYGLGFIINADKFYFGFQADNLAKHKQSIYGDGILASTTYSGIIGADYQSRNKKMTLSPFATFYNKNEHSEIWGGMNMTYQYITFGGGYSTENEFSASLGLKFKTFKLIYQYDRTKSYLTNDFIGSHNLGIRINTLRKKLR